MTKDIEVQEWNDDDFFNSLSTEVPETPVKQEEVVEEKPAVEIDKFISEDELNEIAGIEEETPTGKPAKQTENIAEPVEIDKDSFYKARIEYSKTIGRLPEDFELEDDVILDDESYSKVMDYENEYVFNVIESQVKAEYSKRLGGNVVEFIEKGGDITKIAELIKEETKVAEINTSTESGQKAVVRQYFEELKWSDDKIKKYIDRLINDDELETEAIEVKSKLEETINKKQEQLVKKQQEIFDKKEAVEKAQINSFASVLESKGMSKKAVQDYVNYAFVDVQQGNIEMPALDFKLLQIQRKPEELFELIEFVNNKAEYLKKKAIEINNPKVDKTFETILKNKATLKTTSSSPQSIKPKIGEFKLNF